MEDTLQSGLRQDQWFSSPTTSEKLLEKRSNSLGSGALHFIRTRSSIRRELKRHCNQSKSSESTSSNNEGGNGGGGVGGLGKWLREHLGGGSRGSHDVSVPLPAKRTGSADKSLTRVTYASQNLYCSLPREHGRHCHNVRKHVQPGLQSRPRSNSANFHDKSHSDPPRAPLIGTITRGGPIYGSEGKTIKRRNRDRRRHSLNETQDGSQNHQKSYLVPGVLNVCATHADGSVLDAVPEILEPTGMQRWRPTLPQVASSVGVPHGIVEPSLVGLVMDGISEEENEIKFAKSNIPSIAEEENEKYEREDKNEDESENMEAVGTELDNIEKDDEEVTPYEEEEEEDEESVEDEEEEDEEEEDEEEYVTTRLSGTSKIIDTESFFIMNEISPEVFRDRRAMIDKFKELVPEQGELRRRNRLLEYWVLKNSGKATARMATLHKDENEEVLEQYYKEVLQDYKRQLDLVLQKKNELVTEMSYYNDKYKEYLLKDYEVFMELINQERSTASGLVFPRTGRQLPEKTVQNLIYRQLNYRELLCTVRLKYIVKLHRYEGIKSRIDQVETLGPGMSSIEYEELCLQQVAYRDKLDERDHEMEKLRNRIQRFAYILSQYKEKAWGFDMDAKNMKIEMIRINVKTNDARERVNNVHSLLARVRSQYNEKRHEAGFLVAQPVLMEMERTLKILQELRDDIEAIKNNIRHLERTVRNKDRSEKSVMTPVLKYKLASKPGRS